MAYIFLDGILFRIRDINSILLCYVIGIYVNKTHGEINFSFKENHNILSWNMGQETKSIRKFFLLDIDILLSNFYCIFFPNYLVKEENFINYIWITIFKDQL